jgi:hypothetical protein
MKYAVTMAGDLSPTMTLRDFENGYWYLEQLKNFAEHLYSRCEEAAEGRTRKGHRHVPAYG